MFLDACVRKDSVFNAYFTWEKKKRVIWYVHSIDGESL